MAGTLSATVAVVHILFLFFAFAHARVPLDLPDDAASVFLPTGKPNSETETKYATDEPESQTRLPAKEIETEFKLLPEEEIEAETGAEMKTETMPLTVMSFRPINRHFPRPPFMRRGHKCRHQFQHGQIKPWLVRLINGRERSYGNDMILARDGKGDGMMFDLVSRNGDVRTVPATLSISPFEHDVRKPHHEDEDDEHEYRRHRHHHHRREEGEEYEREERERKHDHGHEHKGEFLRKIRKFLDGF